MLREIQGCCCVRFANAHQVDSRDFAQFHRCRYGNICGKIYSTQDKKIVVTIPADLEVTETETSVLSKGLAFVPVSNKIDEYQVKAGCEKYFCHLRLKAHFHGQAENLTGDATPTETDHFAKFDAKLSVPKASSQLLIIIYTTVAGLSLH